MTAAANGMKHGSSGCLHRFKFATTGETSRRRVLAGQCRVRPAAIPFDSSIRHFMSLKSR